MSTPAQPLVVGVVDRYIEMALRLQDVQGKSLAVGLMSGISMDGIDACVVEITEETRSSNSSFPRLRLLGYLTHPYPRGLRAELLRVCAGGRVGEVCSYNVLLGRLFAEAARAVVASCGVEMENIAVIGSHGQTIHHLPSPTDMYGYLISSTLQIADPSVIANECGVTTVGDFRVADMAVGGQGAPLVPYLDQALLQNHFKERGRLGLLLNVGGISNVSAYIPGDKPLFVGFDCGPGNVLIDALMMRWYGTEFDQDGRTASTGKVSTRLLDSLLKDEYLATAPPKSTGREYYGNSYIDNILERCTELELSQEDCVATVTAFTVAAVKVNYEQFIRPHFKELVERSAGGPPPQFDLYVSGGGARNVFLMRCLQERFSGFHVGSTEEIGIDPDAKEAICFALLAHQTCRGRPTNVPGVTGARKQVILGKICPVLNFS